MPLAFLIKLSQTSRERAVIGTFQIQYVKPRNIVIFNYYYQGLVHTRQALCCGTTAPDPQLFLIYKHGNFMW